MNETVAAILTVWKRNYFKEQVQSLLSQSIKPDIIFAYQNKKYVDPSTLCSKYGIHIVYSDYDFKCFGRFSVPILLGTDYCIILDDDIIPGRRWIEHCLQSCKKHNAIIGGAGRIIEKTGLNTFDQRDVGGCPPLAEDTPVDFIIHSYFFKTEWSRYMWYDRPWRFDTGEDIQFSAACKIYGGIDAIVPKQPKGARELWNTLKPELAGDEYASFRNNPHHDKEREEVINHWLKKGWKLTKDANLI